jgi:DNA-binding response OmpR family regulator
MARVLISEPHEDVRRLLGRMLEHLGHEPVVYVALRPGQLMSIDALIVEPAAPAGIVLVQAAQIVAPSLSIICASVDAPPAELTELGIEFAACLVKPFAIGQLAAAIDRALASQVDPARNHHRYHAA